MGVSPSPPEAQSARDVLADAVDGDGLLLHDAVALCAAKTGAKSGTMTLRLEQQQQGAASWSWACGSQSQRRACAPAAKVDEQHAAFFEDEDEHSDEDEDEEDAHSDEDEDQEDAEPQDVVARLRKLRELAKAADSKVPAAEPLVAEGASAAADAARAAARPKFGVALTFGGA